jgi:DNA (cytosine-5)-methyltransferase 1
MKNGHHRKPTVASLYAGIGGICRAFERAGGTMIWANEFDKHAQETYELNFPNHHLFKKDVAYYVDRLERMRKSRFFLMPDILTSGFPCQAFSIAGRQLGFKDLRGLHFFKTISFLQKSKYKKRPKAYLFENVKNLQGHDKGRTIKRIEEEIVGLGYSCVIRTLNSMTHANIPQNRERVFIIGFENESIWNKDKSFQTSRYAPRTYAFMQIPVDKIPLKKNFRSFVRKSVKNKDYYYKYTNPKMHQRLKDFVKSRDTGYQWRRVYTRENKSNVCPTLTAHMGTGGHNVPIVRDTKEIRKLTPQECARFQGFKVNELRFPNKMADCHKYKQIGNSVTVPLVERIANAIIMAITS